MTEPIDIRDQITNGYTGRYRLNPDAVIGIAIHHSVSGGVFHDPIPDTQDQEIAHLKAIDAYHVQKGWGGFGYHLAAFPSGRLYYCGGIDFARAHVASRNSELIGLVLIGDFTTSPAPHAQLDAAGYGVAFIRRTYAGRPLKGHREWALPEFPTACPGATWLSWIGATDFPPQEDDMNEAEVTALFNRLHAAAHAGGGQRTHTIVSGDTFWDLAGAYYGDNNQWMRIRDANPGIDPYALSIGQVIVIP